ncbi:MAG: hypothetical protein GY720_18825 [bacterium]|nr:hypothetical protein [bacterium]
MGTRSERAATLLKELGLVVSSSSLPGAVGAFNLVVPCRTAAGEELVLRCRRTDDSGARRLVADYWDTILWAIGSGCGIRLRTLSEQVEVAEAVRTAGVETPRIRRHGEDWQLLERLKGRPLSHVLGHADANIAQRAAAAFVSTVARLLAADILVPDRWGGNELVLESGAVALLDFDIAYADEARTDELAAVELELAARTALRWGVDREAVGQAIVVELLEWHQPAAIAEALRGLYRWETVKSRHSLALATPRDDDLMDELEALARELG